MQEHRQYQLWGGIDIAAETGYPSGAVAWGRSSEEPSKPVTFPQTPDGYAHLQQRLHETGVAPGEVLVVMEATSSYWITLAVTLHHAGFAVSVVNPTQVHNYAKSLPRRSKTDVLDAQLVLQFALERKPVPWTPPPDVYHEPDTLRVQRLVARDALLEMRQQAGTLWVNQRHALVQWPVQIASVKAHLDAVIADLDIRIATLEQEIRAVLEQSAWAESARLLQTINSVGPLTAAWLLVLTLNFHACASSAAAVAYAGLAPRLRESGKSVRARPQIGGGNKRLRTALYLATLNAARFTPVSRDVYERLRAKGKPQKVARWAAARKLLQIAWAVVHSGQACDPNYGQHEGKAA